MTTSTSIENITNILISYIENEKYNKINIDFFQGIFEIIIDCMELIEQYYNDKEGRIKKEIVISIGKQLVHQFYPDKLEYYLNNVSDIIETIINSYKILSNLKIKSKNKCCLFF